MSHSTVYVLAPPLIGGLLSTLRDSHCILLRPGFYAAVTMLVNRAPRPGPQMQSGFRACCWQSVCLCM